MKRFVLLLITLVIAIFFIQSVAGYDTMPVYNAENYDVELSSVTDGFGLNEYGADCVSVGGALSAGDYLVYKNVDFGGMKAAMLEASASYTQSAKPIELRLDSASGELVGTFSLVTCSANEIADNNLVFKESYITFSGIEGTHDVYLVFPEDINFNIDYFVLSTYDGTETAEAFDERMKWWTDARYGQFIHWSSFSRGVDGNGVACWDMTSLGMGPAEYSEKVASKWNPENWDAEQIVANAQRTGQKYIVITSRHHNGLSIFDTKIRHFKEYKLGVKDGKPWFLNGASFTSPYNMEEKGDPLKQLSDACYATLNDDDPDNDVYFGTYYTIMDWADKNFNMSSNELAAGGSMGEYKTRLKGQMKELLVDYGTQLLWGDGDWLPYVSAQDGVEMYRFARTISPNVIINERVGNRYKGTLGDYATPEQEITAHSRLWESCITMSNEWSYRAQDTVFKDEHTVIDTIYKCVTVGGNLLLNVGPDGDGIVPEDCMNILYNVGDWLDVYGASVYKAGKSIYGRDMIHGYTSTQSGNTLYVFVKELPGDGIIEVPMLKNEKYTICELSNYEQKLNYTTTATKIEIDASAVVQNEYGNVFAIVCEDTPELSDVETKNFNLAREASAVYATNNYSNMNDYSAAKAIDGDPSTRLATNNDTSEFNLILEYDNPISFNKYEAKFFLNSTCNILKSYNIEVLNEETDEWEVIYTENSPSANDAAVLDKEYSARKIALHVTSGAATSIYEFGLYLEQYDYDDVTVSYMADGEIINTEKIPYGTAPTYNAELEDSEVAGWIYKGELVSDLSKLEICVDTTLVAVLVPKKVPAKLVSTTASTYYMNMATYDGAKATDGLSNTRWATEDNQTDVTLDLVYDKAITVNGYTMSCFGNPDAYAAGERVGTYYVQYYADGEWKNAYEHTPGKGAWSETYTNSFAPVKSDKFRVHYTNAKGPSVWEFTLNEAEEVVQIDNSLTVTYVNGDSVLYTENVERGARPSGYALPENTGKFVLGWGIDGKNIDPRGVQVTKDVTFEVNFLENYKIVPASKLVGHITTEPSLYVADGGIVEKDGCYYQSIKGTGNVTTWDNTYFDIKLSELENGAELIMMQYPVMKIGYRTNINCGKAVDLNFGLTIGGSLKRLWGPTAPALDGAEVNTFATLNIPSNLNGGVV